MNVSDYVLCIRNEGFEASLEPRKLYRSLVDDVARTQGHLRVIDESGEDYLFPEELFEKIDLPASVLERLKDVA